MPSLPMSKNEAKWRAEDDARTLSEAEVIKRDPKRLKAAQKAAARMAKEAADRAAGMRRIGTMKLSKYRAAQHVRK